MRIFLITLTALLLGSETVLAKWTNYPTSGKWCRHSRLETTVSPASRQQCLNWCTANLRQFCMWDYGTSDGFCMASNDCIFQELAGDGRRYNVYKWQYQWVQYQTGGGWCNHPRLETRVPSRTVNQCQEWCEKNNQKFCMWDYGTADGFCMASNDCRSTVMAGDRRRYHVWQWQ